MVALVVAASLSSPLLIFTELEVHYCAFLLILNLPNFKAGMKREQKIIFSQTTEIKWFQFITSEVFLQVKSSMATGEVFSYCYEVKNIETSW